MKTVVILASVVTFCVANFLPPQHTHQTTYETVPVDAQYVERERKILSLFQDNNQIDLESDYYKVGKDYDLEANIDKYTDKKAVQEFLYLYRTGTLPKFDPFTVFEEKMRYEAIALFNVFYYANDFDTFYKTACFAKVHFNQDQFLYAYYLALIHREEMHGVVLPAPYELNPSFFVNAEVITKVYHLKLINGLNAYAEKAASKHGVFKRENEYVFYANYSDYTTYGDNEHWLSYFTEDIGLNSYFFFQHLYFPFWMEGQKLGQMKNYRGEGFYFIIQKLIARYYMERLTNRLGEIPEFSWYLPIKHGYTCQLYKYYPFVQRNDYYNIPLQGDTLEDLQFVDTYEKTFLQYLQKGHFKDFNREVDLHEYSAINFLGNYWESTADLYEKTGPRNYESSYEIAARRLLSNTPKVVDGYKVMPSALAFYQTSLRDPMFWQLYYRIFNYFLQAKEYLTPYTNTDLRFEGVKINSVEVDELKTYFEPFEYDITNGIYLTPEEMKTKTIRYKIRQPRLNHKPFTVTIDVKSDVSTDAVFKIFLGPKFDSKGYPIPLQDNWKNFVPLDWFVHKLEQGVNKIERKSENFHFYQEDYVSIPELYKYLEQGKVPKDMYEEFELFPERLMLPKGDYGGFPFQFFVVVYPYHAAPAELGEYTKYILDNKPLGYPFDRQAIPTFFKEPNMYFEDVKIYHEGEFVPMMYNVPGYVPKEYKLHENEVPKH